MVASYVKVTVTVAVALSCPKVQVADVVPLPVSEPPAVAHVPFHEAVEPVFAVFVAVAVNTTFVP
jgi:hypothetical protein